MRTDAPPNRVPVCELHIEGDLPPHAMMDILVYAAIVALCLVIVGSYWTNHHRAAHRARARHDENREAGVGEPVTLHPSLDPNRCIGIGACVSACPEGEILGIVDGRAVLIEPTRCIGHSACAAACPVDAITLVFGTATRGVDIPMVRETFETNVEGIYIAGELGGMGLIRNAVTQGRQAVENLSQRRSHDPSVADVVIVGAGPAGLSASLQAETMALRYVTVDQDDVGGTLLSYPRQKLVMTQPMEIPMYGRFNKREARKEELLELWKTILQTTGVEVNTFERLESVVKPNGHFVVTTTRNEYATKNILLAIGRRGTPRKLGVPGEGLPTVTYKLIEPEQYRGRRMLVVGGGDSAVEAAVTLGQEEATRVTLSYRRDGFSRIKPENKRRIEAAADAGAVDVRFGSEVREIRRGEVVIEQGGKVEELANDYTLVLAGGELPTPLLRKLGVEIETKFGKR
jgi:thioredoxin reductase/NAD-dependent dihydropyrimidine dehydrogenase PreA subunit